MSSEFEVADKFDTDLIGYALLSHFTLVVASLAILAFAISLRGSQVYPALEEIRQIEIAPKNFDERTLYEHFIGEARSNPFQNYQIGQQEVGQPLWAGWVVNPLGIHRSSWLGTEANSGDEPLGFHFPTFWRAAGLVNVSLC